MTERGLKNRVGLFLIAVHLFIIVLVLVCFAVGGFDFDEMTTVLAVIVPMFAGYSTAVISHIVNERFVLKDTSKPVSGMFASLAFVLPTLFAMLIVAAILLQARGLTFADFEQFKKSVILIESLFAVYIGRLIFSMFERPEPTHNQPKPAAQDA